MGILQACDGLQFKPFDCRQDLLVPNDLGLGFLGKQPRVHRTFIGAREVIPVSLGDFSIARKIGKFLALVKNGIIQIGSEGTSVLGLQVQMQMKLHHRVQLGNFHEDGLSVLQGMERTNLDRIMSGESGIPDGIFRGTVGFAVQVVPLGGERLLRFQGTGVDGFVESKDQSVLSGFNRLGKSHLAPCPPNPFEASIFPGIALPTVRAHNVEVPVMGVERSTMSAGKKFSG